MSATPLIRILSFVGFFFECPAVGFDMSWFLTVVADSVVPGLAPVSLILRRSGGTSSPVVRSVSQTFYDPLTYPFARSKSLGPNT